MSLPPHPDVMVPERERERAKTGSIYSMAYRRISVQPSVVAQASGTADHTFIVMNFGHCAFQCFAACELFSSW
eukprot:6235713-Amphidinium_carterae.1